MGRIRSRFLRALIESLQRETHGAALSRLRSGLPPHSLALLGRQVLAATDRDATVDLDAGLELLSSCDRVLSGGSGAATVRALTGLASSVLSHSSGLVVPGDIVRTLQHLRAPFEQPFVGAELRYSARRHAAGLLLELELVGEPRAARWLGWAGLGYVKAAAAFSGKTLDPLRLDLEFAGDAVKVLGRGTTLAPPSSGIRPAPESGEPPRRPSSQRRRAIGTNAAAEVEQILKGAPGGDTRVDSAPRIPSGLRPAERKVTPPVRKAGS